MDILRKITEARRNRIGSLLKRAREKRGLSQADVSRHFGYGSPQFVSNWERGLSLPPQHEMPRVCDLLGIEPADLVDAYLAFRLEESKIQMAAVFGSSTKKKKGA